MGRLIRLDWAIKNILRQKANFDILQGFLSELLQFDVTISEILESESNKWEERAKMNRVDILVKDVQGKLILIEVQNDSELDYLQRILFGSSKLVVEHIDQGNPYAYVRKVITVSIVYFNLGKGEDYIYHGTTTFKGLRKKDQLRLNKHQRAAYQTEDPKGLFPEHYLIKVPKFNNEVKDTLDEWIYFLKNEKIKPEFTAKGIRAANERLSMLRLSDEERSQYDSYLEDLRYQASMVHSSYGTGQWEGRREVLIAGIRTYQATLGLERTSEKELADKFTDELQVLNRKLFDQVANEKQQAERSQREAEQSQRKAEQSQRKAEQSQREAEEAADQEREKRRELELELAELRKRLKSS